MQERLVVVDPKTTLLDPKGEMKLPAMLIPSFRQTIAMQRGHLKKILFKSWGGLGDQVCAEPTLRYALDNLLPHGYEIYLEAFTPELFQHLPFKKIFNHFTEKQDEDDYYVFHTICSDKDFFWEYVCHLYTHCVDFASLIALRCQLPLAYKEIKLEPNEEQKKKVIEILKTEIDSEKFIVLHPGRHWQSKTFPKWWWDRVIRHLRVHDIVPVLIGGHTDNIQGLRTTVDVNPRGCLDLRCKLTIMETTALLKNSKVLLTNDSVPLHLAASTEAWIGFIALNKHPEHITHYRHGMFGWRMHNMGRGGVWEIAHILQDIVVVDIGDNLEKWLPPPEEFAQWGIDKIIDSIP